MHIVTVGGSDAGISAALVAGPGGAGDVIAYDQLIVSTGAVPARLLITGLDETETEGLPDA